jgi:hypothetical protein
MNTASKLRRTLSVLPGIALVSLSTAAMAQNAPPPAYQDPNAPPPAYQQEPQNAPPPGYQDPNAPPPAGYPPPGGYPPGGYPPGGYPPPTAYAPPPVMNQHAGLYLHLHLGGGFTSLSASSGGTDVKLSGASGSFAAALGGTVSPNLIVYGSIFGSSMSDPDLTITGYGTSSTSGTVSLIGVGPGLAYYIEPVNMYVAGTLAAMKISSSDSNGNNTGESSWGVGFQGLVGKEWWMTPEWGLGIAGEIIVASMKDSTQSDITWTGTAFNVLFSATFN